MRHLLRRNTVAGPISWMGSLVQDNQDASGLMYRRNRFYDPQNGRFTQEDPIGLAGGVNLYGFAEGDAVSFDDPYGLCPPKNEDRSDCSWSELVVLRTGDKVRPWEPALSAAEDGIVSAGMGMVGGWFLRGAGRLAAAGRALFRGRQAATAATAASRILIREGDAVLGVVHEGKLIAKTFDVALSHKEFVRRTVGALPEGAEVVTIGKFQGEITVLRSANFHGRAFNASNEALEAAKAVFR